MTEREVGMMPRLLLPIDGSTGCLRAIDAVLRRLDWFKSGAKLHLLNVQPAFSGDVSMFIPAEQLREVHQQEGLKALAAARAKLDAAKRPYVHVVRVGDPSGEIVRYAKAEPCDEICMCRRGLGTVGGILLGSVSTKVIKLSPIPVLIVP